MVEKESIDNEEPKIIDVWREIPLKHGEIHFGELGLQLKGKNKLLIKIVKKDLKGKEEIILAPEEVSIDFYNKPKVRDKVFKHVKNALKADEQYNKFIDGVRFKIEKWKLEQGKQPKKEIKTLEVSEHEKKLANAFAKTSFRRKIKFLDKLLQNRHIGDRSNLISGFFIILSSLTPYKMMLSISGLSSAGKGDFCNAILDFFPQDLILLMGPMSPTVLKHMNWKEEDKPIFFIPDIDEIPGDLRFFAKEDKIVPSWTEGSPDVGFQVVQNEMPTKTLVLATAKAKIDRQLTNRTVTINIDESKEQTKRIVERKLKVANGKYTKISALWFRYYIKEYLKPFDEIVIPYADKLKDILNTEDIRVRRDITKLTDIIRACAFFNQTNRFKTDKILYAMPEDFILLLPILKNTFEETITGLNNSKRLLIDILEKANSEEVITYSSLRERLRQKGIKKGKSTIIQEIEDLEDMGLVSVNKEGRTYTISISGSIDEAFSIDKTKLQVECKEATIKFFNEEHIDLGEDWQKMVV